MSAEKLSSFPIEPIRRVTEAPTIASGNPTDKDGQRYFWDNVVQFPESFTKANSLPPIIPQADRLYIASFREEQKKIERDQEQLTLDLSVEEKKTTDAINWPEEDPQIGEGFYYPHLGKVPPHYVRRNQTYWRNAKRGLISRPLVLVHSGDFLHKKMLTTFNLVDSDPSHSISDTKPMRWPEEDKTDGRGWSYPNTEKKPWSFRDPKTEPLHVYKPILVGSVVFDNPANSTSEFVHAERFPAHIPEKDRKAWSIGMERITEYATNYATRRLFKTIMNFPLGEGIAEIYNEFSDLVSYKLLIGGTYRRMGAVEQQALANGKDYEDALYKGLFAHDFTAINELIADTKEYSDCSNIDDMALQIGHEKFTKIDIGKILGKLEIKPENGKSNRGIKNLAISCLAGGVYRNPGVTEVSAAGIALMIIEPVVVNSLYLLAHPELAQLIKSTRLGVNILDSLAVLAASGVATYGLVLPFVGAHENIHNYSANRKFMGYIHSEIIRKETTPGFAMLEPQEEKVKLQGE